MKNIVCRRPTNLYSRKGCPRACSFCARIDKDRWRARDVHRVYREIRHLVEEYDVDYVVDMSDTWIQRDWVAQYRAGFRQALGDLNFRMHVFADVRDISEDHADLMRDVKIDQALLGIESGSERVLRANGKFYTRQRILNAARRLTDRGIGIYASFVIGLLGEDEESISETASLISLLGEFPGVRCYVNILLPLPGSPLWQPFIASEQGLPESLGDPFRYQVKEIREAFLERHTNVDLEFLEEFRNSVLVSNGLEVLEYAR